MISSRRQLLLWPALILVTGYSAPCFAQWVEIFAPVVAPLWSNTPQACDSAWGRQYHCWPWPAEWSVASSANPTPTINPDLRVHLMSEFQPGGGYLTCPRGWWDWLRVTLSGATIIAADDGAFVNGPHAGDPLYLDDVYTSDSHWEPFSPDETNGPEPIPDGVWTFYLEPNTLAASGTLGGIALNSVDADIVKVTRASGGVSIYIGPLFAATDLTRNGAVDGQDLFRFLACWFRGDLAGDWDGDRVFTVADIFAYLSVWFEERE